MVSPESLPSLYAALLLSDFLPLALTPLLWVFLFFTDLGGAAIELGR